MIKLWFIVLALMLELSGMAAILKNGSSDWSLFVYLLLHAVASFLLAVAGWYFLTGKYRQPRWLITLLLFNFAFFIPFLRRSCRSIQITVSLPRIMAHLVSAFSLA